MCMRVNYTRGVACNVSWKEQTRSQHTSTQLALRVGFDHEEHEADRPYVHPQFKRRLYRE